MVEAGINTGYLAQVKRAADGKTKWASDKAIKVIELLIMTNGIYFTCSQCFFSMESASCKNRFLSQVNSSFGNGGMSMAMNDLQFAGFILHLKSQQQGMPIKKAATLIGKQPGTNVWVLGKELQVSNRLHAALSCAFTRVWINVLYNLLIMDLLWNSS